MAQPTWQFYLTDKNGGNLGELLLATSRDLTIQLNNPSVLTFKVPVTEATTALITPGNTLVKAYRTDLNGNKLLRFHGIVWDLEYSGASSGVDMLRVIVSDPFVRLQRRFTRGSVTSTPGGALKSLIDTANGIATTMVQTSSSSIIGTASTFSFDYTDTEKALADIIGDLASAQDGADIELSPIEYTGGAICNLNVWHGDTRRGFTQGNAVFGFGATTADNCSAMTYRLSMDNVATSLTTRGSNANGVDGEITATFTNATAQTTYGYLDARNSYSDVTDATILSNRTYLELSQRRQPPAIVKFTCANNAPRMFDTWNIGDTVRVEANKGAMLFQLYTRVIGATLQIDDNGVELVSNIATTNEGT